MENTHTFTLNLYHRHPFQVIENRWDQRGREIRRDFDGKKRMESEHKNFLGKQEVEHRVSPSLSLFPHFVVSLVVEAAA